MPNKFLNIRIGVDFYNKLNSHQAYQHNWKAISPAFYFLQRIANLQEMKDGRAVEFHSVDTKKIFEPYYLHGESDYSYKIYLKALEDLQLITVNHSFLSAAFAYDGVGRCKTYLVTPECLDLLSNSNVEYLKALHTNKDVIRRNKDNIRKRDSRASCYQDYVISYINDGLKHFEYDYGMAMAMVTGSNWERGTQQSAEQSLIAFKTKDFGTLKYNNSDGRVFNEFVAMKSDLRQAFKYKKMERKAVIDIRACHPTFFSTYILEYSILSPITTTLHTTTLQDVGGFVRGQDYNKAIHEENEKWVSLFTNPLLDPRDVIGSQIGYNKSETKQALNESLNGSKQYPRLLKWIQINYPCLYDVWQSTDVKETGPNIAKLYESRIMLHPEIYKQTEAQGLKIAYEYDGISVFSDNMEQSALVNKVDYLAKRIQFLANKECGVSLVLKVEFTSN